MLVFNIRTTVFPRIIAGAIISIFAPKGGDYSMEGDYSREAIIQRRLLFQIFLTGGRALNILFSYTEQKSEIHEHYHAKKPDGFVTIQL